MSNNVKTVEQFLETARAETGDVWLDNHDWNHLIDMVDVLRARITELETALADANADAAALADELRIEQNHGYTCEALHDHYARIGVAKSEQLGGEDPADLKEINETLGYIVVLRDELRGLRALRDRASNAVMTVPILNPWGRNIGDAVEDLTARYLLAIEEIDELNARIEARGG